MPHLVQLEVKAAGTTFTIAEDAVTHELLILRTRKDGTFEPNDRWQEVQWLWDALIAISNNYKLVEKGPDDHARQTTQITVPARAPEQLRLPGL